MYYIKFICNSA